LTTPAPAGGSLVIQSGDGGAPNPGTITSITGGQYMYISVANGPVTYTTEVTGSGRTCIPAWVQNGQTLAENSVTQLFPIPTPVDAGTVTFTDQNGIVTEVTIVARSLLL